MTDFHYVGSELELFAQARHWKAYLASAVRPFLGQDILEVGAGQGGTTSLLGPHRARKWVCLEPDEALVEKIAQAIAEGVLPPCCHPVAGQLGAAGIGSEPFDTLLYIDVLEHIEDDADEVRRALGYLRPGGHLVVLAPAHQWLFTPFDAAIGHFRRYSKQTLSALTPADARLVRLRYLDSCGLFASLANRLLLKQSMPTPRQIAVWDSAMVPVSRITDRLFCYSFGKSVLAVWRRV